MRRYNGSMRSKKGAVLIFFYFVIVSLLVVFGAFINRGIVERRMTKIREDDLQAYYLAEAGLDQVKRNLFNAFNAANPQPMANSFGWFNTPANLAPSVPPANTVLAGVNGSYTVVIDPNGTGTVQPNMALPRRDIELQCTATINPGGVGGTQIQKIVSTTISYDFQQSPVFDYSYFINNLGWWSGGGVTSQGDMRSNGDFEFSGNPEVNGNVYAPGTITGSTRSLTIAQYRVQADNEARPTNPTANGLGNYENGYDGNSNKFAGEDTLTMPYLGDLSDYESMAISEGGTITQCGTVVVTNVLGDDVGENNDIVLDGTGVCLGGAPAIIQLNGPVVVRGDVLIKGTVSGQGVIYSGRNTHILGNIEYANGPSWSKPDTTPNSTDIANATRDFLGLVAKGNVVVGDYTDGNWQAHVPGVLKPPFTKAYDIDPTDAALGYDNLGGNRFDGDYTGKDGGKKSDNSDRRFYESSYDDTYFDSIADSNNAIRRVDAVTYTNHFFGGRMGNFTINGSIIARDDAIIYGGGGAARFTMNYDIRVKSMGSQFNLPGQQALPRTRYFRRN